jgi:hypothetical protein
METNFFLPQQQYCAAISVDLPHRYEHLERILKVQLNAISTDFKTLSLLTSRIFRNCVKTRYYFIKAKENFDVNQCLKNKQLQRIQFLFEFNLLVAKF